MADTDVETVIDGVAVTIHTTDKQKTVFAFPIAAPDLSITVDNGGDALALDPERVAAALLTAARSSGLVATPPSNAGHYGTDGGYSPVNDPLNQGRQTNSAFVPPTY